MKKSVLIATVVLCIGLLSPISLPASAMAMHIKAVLFDSYGTIVSWEGVETAVADVLRQKGSTVDPKAFNGAWRLSTSNHKYTIVFSLPYSLACGIVRGEGGAANARPVSRR